MQTWSFRGDAWHEGEVEGASFCWFDITGPVKRRYNNTLRGLEKLPITITAA